MRVKCTKEIGEKKLVIMDMDIATLVINSFLFASGKLKLPLVPFQITVSLDNGQTQTETIEEIVD